MAMTINTNTASLNAQRNTALTSGSLSTTMQRLSSGLRVNSAKDDAAGLAIADRMNTQVRGMNVAIRNAGDGISMAQIAEGGLSGINDMLQRMRELAVQASNSTNQSSDISKLDKEYQELGKEVTRMIDATQFNGESILKTTAGFTFQIGANTGTENQIKVDSATVNVATGNLALVTTGANSALSTAAAASNTAQIDALDKALTVVNDTRANLGAVQNRFENTVSYLRTAVENQSAARGRIMDADFAAETANLSRAQILQQAGTAMIAQANQLPQGVLSLLR
ncbi:flagellin domain-containing protein [Comamonas faecalis]|uniref:Flagellin n=1 Tax=Comamonas faecalis TaxID=1387849 RepID=A0ABP7QHI5_9BURK